MSRLDYITILIVVVGIAALGYLIYKIYQNNSQQQSRVNQVETPYEPGQETDDETASYPSEEDYNNSITPQDDDYYDEEGTGFEESSAARRKDQSATTADENEFTNKGTQEQETAPMDEDFDNTATSSSFGNYMVIAGTFSIKQNAENQAKKLRQMGYSSASSHLFDRGAYAVVIVDRFDSYSEAKRLKEELAEKHNVEAIVQKKK